MWSVVSVGVNTIVGEGWGLGSSRSDFLGISRCSR